MKARNLKKSGTGRRNGNTKMMKRFIAALVVGLGLASAGLASAELFAQDPRPKGKAKRIRSL